MKMTEKKLRDVNQITKYIFEYYPLFKDINKENNELFFSEERITEIVEDKEEILSIDLWHPGNPEEYKIDINEYFELADEIKSITVETNGLIKTNLRRYYIVNANDSNENYIISDYIDFINNQIEGITVKLRFEPLVTALVASNLEFFEPDYYRHNMVIEIIYKNNKYLLNSEDEVNLINSFIFEIADSIGIALNYSEIIDPQNEFYKLREKIEEDSNFELRELESYNEGMKLFVSATQIKDPELKFLNFYKVLEHFAPVAVNIEANELMRKKLDATKKQFENGDYIRSIFELANSMKEKFNDVDLIKASFSTCIDSIGLFEFLPFSLKKRILKHLRIPTISYTTEKQKIITLVNMLSKTIYKTRNKVVHAKSNFTATGDEVIFDEFDQLNTFMRKASSQAIRWYNRQPSHLKLKVI